MQQKIIESEKKPTQLALQVAVIYAIYSLILLYIFKAIGIDTQDKNLSIGYKVLSTVLTYVPFILAIFYAQWKHKSELGGFMSFGRGFSTGFRVALLAGLFGALLMLLYYLVLDPGALDQIMDTAKANAKTEQEEQAIDMMSKYMIWMIVFGVILFLAFFGTIVSLIGAAIFKKERPVYIDTENNRIVEG
ncbi:hypothetical protein C7T94_18165 [Pedobacter yulinensis]|uniref:DUF4199 domain-containing protein n=1 Tax=Pedobacter yulinensis TaxID=2126353 RepID=A0A2T3HH71_9SPHI|nr:DUF4199 domain-containing protein [Pedobacter yulinensis]PST81795.1 hypothetical protein C7T94_18165 [Pedobacter yulinensis]